MSLQHWYHTQPCETGGWHAEDTVPLCHWTQHPEPDPYLQDAGDRVCPLEGSGIKACTFNWSCQAHGQSSLSS